MSNLLKLVKLVLSVSILSLVSGDDPKVVISSTDPQISTVGNYIVQDKTRDVQLECTVENKPLDAEVLWVMMPVDGPEVSISLATRSYDPNKWSIDKPQTTSWRLRIKSIRESDEGVYTCKVSVSQQNYIEDQRAVKVVEPPLISDLYTSNDMTKSAGDSALLECYATGRPTPVITWSRIAGELLPGGGTEFRGNELDIDVVEADHAGDYKCTASNAYGSTSKKIRLTVNFSPRVTTPYRMSAQKLGYPMVLVCNIMGYPQPLANSITWTRLRDNKPLMTGSRYEIRNIPGARNKITSRLVINPVTEIDYSSYRCASVNDKGTGYIDITLRESSEPTHTHGYFFGTASSLSTSIATIFMMLTVWMLHRLQWRH